MATTKLSRAKEAVSSWSSFKKAIQTDDSPDKEEASSAYYNADLLPTPPSQRTWTTMHFFAYYLTTTFSPSSYNLGSSLVSKGLQWWHGMIAAVIGSIFLSIVVVLNSRGAAKYHVGFPVYTRASSGIGGAKLFIFVRASVATIYFAVQSYYGGQLTSVCLRAMIGQKWDSIPNHLPADAGITSKNLLAFFIFWILQFPVMFLHPTILRHLFVFKAVYTTVALFGVMGWAIHKNGGSIGSFSFQTSSLHGSALVWPMISAINSVMGALCPILINQPDVARYAKRYSQVTWSQSVGILLSKVLVMFVSCATTSATTAILGKAYWNVWDLYNAILTEYWSPAARAGIFFASLGMILAIIATNAGTNSLPVGADTSGLFPRYINIVRGQVLCALLAPLCVPWKIIASASSFLTFLGSYTVFLMPICAIMVVDYWIIRKGNFHIPSLYTKAPGTPYAYWHGWNPRALVAWVCGVVFVVHGVAGSLHPGSVNAASTRMYSLGFFLSFLMGGFVFYLLNLVWPVPIYPTSAEADTPKTWEYMTTTEGMLDEDSMDMITGGRILNGLEDGSHIRDENVTMSEKAYLSV
ncbi:uncharacterized protein BHQ10_006627 [Talaromyces amestolkiae]|uniref:Allantoin permease n=1 Tax=Talaromyces amestolkiae TaxID=1196081 RepID=A0A364L474_TALAM|nr:uncharacterized protein BHQ10_006627 [Talaromyces amestolkiae]RAO70615.1 hypothetical protein BHQ10_006627 [Talaromyces amestolkiae]